MDVNTSVHDYENMTISYDMDYPVAIHRKYLKGISDKLTVVVLIVIMFSMGCDITWREIWSHVRVPIGVIIGMVCQFMLMPLMGFFLLKVLTLDGPYAIGLLIISCCPGGALSNIFTYFLDGDVSLSVTMTTLSTLLALGLMPLNLWMYGQSINVHGLVIPYGNMATSLVIVTSPVCVGMALAWKFPKLTKYITKVGSVLSFLLIIVVMTLHYFAYPEIYINPPLKVIVAVIIMPLSGMVGGYTLSWTFRRTMAVRKTVSVESGIQNAGIAVTVIALSSFTFEVQGPMMLVPVLYVISMSVFSFVFVVIYQIKKRTAKESGPTTETVEFTASTET